MKVFLHHIDPEWSATFTSTITKNNNDYGNGIYMTITRNGKEFKYIDCRYIKDFNEERVLKQVLNNYYGSNVKAIDITEF